MADVSIKYKGTEKSSLNTSGTKIIKTKGKYCEDNITIEYVSPKKEEQEVTVNPNTTGFNLRPDDGKVYSLVKVNGDSNLIAENIRKDVSIFGVVGNYEATVANSKTITVALYDDVTVQRDYPLISNDKDIAEHFSEDRLVVTVRSRNSFENKTATYYVSQGNHAYGAIYGSTICSNTSSVVTMPVSVPLNHDVTLQVARSLTVDASGNLVFAVSENYPLRSGIYDITISW